MRSRVALEPREPHQSRIALEALRSLGAWVALETLGALRPRRPRWSSGSSRAPSARLARLAGWALRPRWAGSAQRSVSSGHPCQTLRAAGALWALGPSGTLGPRRALDNREVDSGQIELAPAVWTRIAAGGRDDERRRRCHSRRDAGAHQAGVAGRRAVAQQLAAGESRGAGAGSERNQAQSHAQCV